MSEPRKELQEIQVALLNIAEKISASLKTLDAQLQKVLNGLYEENQKKLQLNNLGVLTGDKYATPNPDQKNALDTINKTLLEGNEKIAATKLKLQEIQGRLPASPADAKEAEAMKKTLGDLTNQNAALANIQKSLQKQVYLRGQEAVTDTNLAQKTLEKVQDQLATVNQKNKMLKLEMQEQKRPVSAQDVKEMKEAAQPESRRHRR